jgi:hypothetical protein
MTNWQTGGLIGYVLDDDDRTRRLLSLLYPTSIILLSGVFVLTQLWPMGAAAGLLACGAGARTARRRLASRRGTPSGEVRE